MTRLILATATVLALAGCGADGMPMATADTPATGVTISGDARMGVVADL